MKPFNQYFDHTLLKADATEVQIMKVLSEAARYEFAAVCVNGGFVSAAAEYLQEVDVKVATVVGFPLGASTSEAKAGEARIAIADGADEIDMVINIGKLKEGADDYVLDEIRQIKAACGGRILKVIIETCLLTEEEKIRMCRIVTESGADFIKTSTGFATAGATFDDVALFAKYVGEGVRIKAAGGISSFEDAQHFAELGASRLGTSRLVKLLKASLAEG